MNPVASVKLSAIFFAVFSTAAIDRLRQVTARHPIRLFLVPVLPLFLLAAIIVIVAVVGFRITNRGQRLLLRSLAFRGFACLAFALATVILPGIENQMQPGHHLLDRRQLAGQSRLAAGTRLTT